MSKAEKTLSRMKNNPRDWKIEDVISLTSRYGIECRNDGGSHHIFSHQSIQEAVSMPAHRPIKPVYIKKITELIDRIREMK